MNPLGWIQDNLATCISLLLGLVGIWLTYIYSAKVKVPKYAVRSISLIEGSDATFPNLEVHYKGHGPDLTNFSVAYVVFWNGGKETIDKKDIVTLGIAIKDGVFLDASIIQANKPENKLQVGMTKDRDYITLTFDYLDYNQGAVIEILHTASSRNDIAVVGTIKGVLTPPIRAFEGRRPNPLQKLAALTVRKKKKPPNKAFPLFVCVFGISMILYAFYVFYEPYTTAISDQGEQVTILRNSGYSAYVFLFIGGLIYLAIGVKMVRRSIPKGLEKYEELF